ncbi:MAG: ribonuclease HII [Tenericutes bacterium]|nr:ribonuclease HII [Mycoplasmatota bacterium]
MNRKEIIEVLNKLDLPKSEYVVLSGASMVMQKVKSKTSDIDISVSKELFGILKNNATIVNSFLGYDVYKVNDYEVEFSNNYSFFDKSNAVLINDIYFQDLNSIKKMKENFNRNKDKNDIKKIDLFLDLKDNLKYEKELYNKGYSLIAGVDEVGRGPLVGPVVAAAVILPKNYKLEGLTDSKKLSEAKRNYFDEIIKRDAISYGIGVIDNNIIDEVNIYEATKLAMKQAISNLKIKPDYVLTDAMKLDIDIDFKPLIKGDLRSLSISAASVIAKVYRDNLMYLLDKKYPYYNFKNNKGYPTKDHIEAIKKYGIIKEHRISYHPVSEYINKK